MYMQDQLILIVGTGPQAQIVADTLRALVYQGGQALLVGMIGEEAGQVGSWIAGAQVIGTLGEIGKFKHDAIICCVDGDIERKAIYEQLSTQGERFVTVVHPAASVALEVEIGNGTYIGAHVVLSVACKVGANVVIRGPSSVGFHARIEDHVTIAPATVIGDDAKIGVATSIEMGAKVLSRVKIGSFCRVSPNSVADIDLPDLSVFGVPEGGDPAPHRETE